MRSMIGRPLLSHVAALFWIAAAHAQAPDPELTFESADGAISVEANGATLGQILDRLFAERGILVDWRDKALAGKMIQGSFKGPIDRVTLRLLSSLNYIAVSAKSDGETRITRVVIFGGGSAPMEIAPRVTIVAPDSANPPASPRLPANAGRFRPKIYK